MMKKLKEEVTLLFDGSSLKTIAAVLMLSGMLFVPAIAHHSTAMFDHNDERSITGVVTKFDYINPHSWIFIDVTNDNGTPLLKKYLCDGFEIPFDRRFS